MAAILTLNLPWVETSSEAMGDLVVRRGRTTNLAYDDGIVLDVRVLDPGAYRTAAAAIEAARSAGGPGRVVLVAGLVPPEWRADLRDAEVSFFDVSGVAEVIWPRIHVSARRFGQPVKRRRSALPMQKGHGLVVQELLVQSFDGAQPSIGDLASTTGVSLSTVSKTVSQLVAHGLAVKHREGVQVSVEVADRVAVARQLADATAWPGRETLSVYLWGRTVFDVAARLSTAADRASVDIAVTGRVGAAYLGLLGSSAPEDVRTWVVTEDRGLDDVAERLGLEPASGDAANVVLSTDRWRIGVHRRNHESFDAIDAWVSHPLRIWCDLHDERRGSEFAAQMWNVVSRGD